MTRRPSSRTRTYLAIVALTAAVTSTGPVQSAPGALEAPPSGVAAPPAEPAAEVSDEKLRQFAEAARDVHTIQQEFAAKAESLQKNTEEKIVSSVEQAGMTVEEFTALVALVQSDPSLARRLEGLSQ